MTPIIKRGPKAETVSGVNAETMDEKMRHGSERFCFVSHTLGQRLTNVIKLMPLVLGGGSDPAFVIANPAKIQSAILSVGTNAVE